MRIGPGFYIVLCLTTGLWGQARSGGSVVNPAGAAGLPGVTRTLGSIVNPAQGGIRVPGSRGTATSGNRVVFAYPVFIGGYYTTPYISSTDDSAAAAQAPAPAQTNVTVVMPPQQPVTPVVINYNYSSAPPSNREYTGDRTQPSVDDTAVAETSHYLIALKDHTIYAATAYWVDGDTLHYFTAGNVHNQASLTLVDREFTQRLNKEAGLDVQLPAPAAK